MMKFIVAQRQINLPRLIVVAFSAIVASCGNGLSAKAAETQPGNSGRTFADWCREKSALSPETKHTVEVLLKKAGTTDCDAANQKLSSLTELNLFANQISDIKPLQSLTNLKKLFLAYNDISDIKPLQSLTKLTILHLYNNKISDIKPLQSLTKLTALVISINKISDIKPLESLTNLTWLQLNHNNISDIKPLQSLTKLTVLRLDYNKISDIKPLQSLTRLTELRLSGNPIAPKTCPLKPESICKWEPPTQPYNFTV
jgi:internalin A